MKENLLVALNFTKRDFQERYVGTGLGQFWSILSPLIMIFIYTIIFSDFMKMKLSISDNSYAYSIHLIPALLAWTAFSTTVIRLSNSFYDKAHFIKKINIPMYTFQLSIALTELIIFTISMLLAIGFLVIIHHPVTWTFLWLIPLMILQTLFALGLGIILSLFTPFFKDLREIIPIAMQLWFWMTPIIYLKEMLAKKYPFLLTYNPFFYFSNAYQDIFLYSKPPSLKALIIIIIVTSITLLLAIYLYKKMVGTIKDII